MVQLFQYRCHLALAGILCLGLGHTASGETIDFAGRTWDLKAANEVQGPGGTFFSDSDDSVWVDSQGLHLTIREIDRTNDGVTETFWHSSQVELPVTLGYGTYQFKIASNPELFEPHVVLGLFVYRDDANEVDIEFTRFGDTAPDTLVGQFVTQPGAKAGNKLKFDTGLDELMVADPNPLTTHQFTWLPDSIAFQSYHGHADTLQSPDDLIAEWVYTGDDIPLPLNDPRPTAPKINLWQFQGVAPSQEVEVIISDFRFTAIPEPSSFVLLSLASSFLLMGRKRGLQRFGQ